MNLKESYNKVLERLKFTFYSTDEVEMQVSQDPTTTSRPEEQEFASLSYNPFASFSNSLMGQQNNQLFGSNKNEMIRRWRDVSYLSKVDNALNEICNEAIVYDEIEDPITINLTNIDLPEPIKTKISDSFQNILYMLDFNEKGDELFRQWYIDGCLNVEVVYDNDRIREGINKLILLSPFNFHHYVDDKTGKKRYFFGDTEDHSMKAKLQNNANVFEDEQITAINSGNWSMDKKFTLSNLNKALKPINQLTLIEDSLVIARISRATEKRAFYIPTNGMNKAQSEMYLQSLISRFRQKKVYNVDTGQVENRTRSVSVLEDYWFPVDKAGAGPRVENIAGTAPGFTSFEDVDYYINEVYKALNIPLNRRASDARLTQGNTIDIEKDELKFFKMITKLRRRFNNLFVDLIKKDLLAKRVMSLEDWMTIQEKIKFNYSNSNEYSEIKNNQILAMRIDTANAATQLVDSGYLSEEYIQTNILRLTPEEIEKIKLANAQKEGKALDGEAEASFGKGYTATRRSPSFDDTFSTPPEKPETTKPDVATPETKPTTPEGGAVEGLVSFRRDDKLIVEKLNPMIFSNLEEGDIITNGDIQLKFAKGKLERIV